MKPKMICYEVKGNIFCSLKGFWDVLLNWDRENIKHGVQINVDLVREAHDFATRQNKAFFVVLIPSKEMIYGPMAKEKDMIYKDSYLTTYTEFESRLRLFDISVFNSTNELFKKAQGGVKLYFTVDGHFNESGHLEMARAIYQYMQDRTR